MLDIDDPSQIALSDRQGWLARAARINGRWAEAIAGGQLAAQGLPDPAGAAVIWLVLPIPLAGIGGAVQAASAHLPGPRVICWQPTLATLPVQGIWLDPYALMDATQPQRLMIPSPPAPESHPTTLFLFLLAILDTWLGRTLAEDAIKLSAACIDELASSTASVPLAENPAKQIAYRLHERLPLFWAEEPLTGIAYDWWQRYTLYAEAKAEWSTAAPIRQVTATARFPRYWLQAGTFVRLAQNAEEGPPWLNALDRLFHRRKLQGMTVAAQEERLPAALLYLLEIGEWVAIYAAALLGVDPAERVALDFLDAFVAPPSPSSSSMT
ncbi:MAG: hypothetical protein KF893_11425 [Caldilineaceae bacterium]|nr:hypothetical protein [Caldilineaceae bacterium]